MGLGLKAMRLSAVLLYFLFYRCFLPPTYPCTPLGRRTTISAALYRALERYGSRIARITEKEKGLHAFLHTIPFYMLDLYRLCHVGIKKCKRAVKLGELPFCHFFVEDVLHRGLEANGAVLAIGGKSVGHAFSFGFGIRAESRRAVCGRFAQSMRGLVLRSARF